MDDPQLNLDLPNTPGMRGELLNAIKRLAHERFIQLEIGIDADFEQLWNEAFFLDGTEVVRNSDPDLLKRTLFRLGTL